MFFVPGEVSLVGLAELHDELEPARAVLVKHAVAVVQDSLGAALPLGLKRLEQVRVAARLVLSYVQTHSITQ